MPEIRTLTVALPFGLGRVNCYLVKADAGYFLIDTGVSNQRAALEKELINASCQPGNLRLIVLTHGDFDHIGNAAYLRQKFGTLLAMHPDDFGMIERGDMFASRGSGNPILKTMAPVLFKFGKSNRVTPDLQLTEEFDLSSYGFDARVISLPGHSRGSIGILTSDGDLFGGDLLENTKQPVLNSIMDDRVAAQASVKKLRGLNVKIIYPGHGAPFSMEQLQVNAATVPSTTA